MARALILLAEGFEDIEALAVIDVLRRGKIDVLTASVNDSDEVTSAHAVRLRADTHLSSVAEETFDAIILPGGGKGTENLRHSEAVLKLLRRQHERGGLLCAICAAPTVLVAADVLDEDIHVTCYPTCQSELGRPWSPAQVVVDKNIITGQAPGSAVLFALVILKTLAGDETARRIADNLVTDVLN